MLKNKDYERLISGKNFVIATDFDGTLVQSDYFPKFGNITKWFRLLRKIISTYNNVQVILFTCREGKDLQEAIDFCKQHGLVFDAVNEDVATSYAWKKPSRKPFAHIYIDDRAIDVEDTEHLLQML